MASNSIRELNLLSFFLAIICILKIQINVEAQLSASCHLRELDFCATSLLVITQSSSGIATTETDLNKQCVHLREGENCFKNYTRRCMTPLQREIVTFSVNSSLSSLLNEFCATNNRNSQLRSTYLKHAPCLSSLQKSGSIKTCLRDLQASLDTLTAPGREHGNRLPLACCTYRKFESCAGAQLNKKCGKDAHQFVSSTIRRATSRLPEVVCRNYRPDTNECKSLLANSTKTNLSKNSKSGNGSSVISRLFAAYASL